MDEGQLKKILGDEGVPPADDNARKVALNLALSEFDAVQKENNNISQGFSLWARLTNRPHMKRRELMNKKYIYGGMATAMVVVLAAGVTLQNYTTGSPSALTQQIVDPSIDPLEGSRAREGGLSPMREHSKGEDTSVSPEMEIAAAMAPQEQVVAEMRMAEAVVEKDKKDFSGVAANIVGNGASAPSAPASISTDSTAITDGEQTARQFGGLLKNLESSESKIAMPTGERLSADASVAQNYIVMPEPMPPQIHQDVGRDKFEDFEENPIKLVQQEPVSTFSIDVDTSSYSFIRKQLNTGVLPQKDAVRVEEMVNYFDYDYALPENKAEPFKPSVTVTSSPWNPGRKLVHIGIKGYDIAKTEAPRSNLVFLLDTSGSMNEPDKLPLLVSSLKMLLDNLKADDTVAIVVYAGSAGTVLESTKVSDKAKIIAALDNLSAGGSTAGAEGIRQAYTLAEASFDKNAVNRVILATDGDFNVGITNPEELQDFVERKRESGIFLSVFGFGQGNYNDQMMQTLAQNGNGVAAYIDTLNEARKVLVEEATSTLFPIAKDVKIQVEFNPVTVAEYRLVGYETRALNREDFNNDKVDAGDIGAGHAVTAIYEITPVGSARAVDDSRYAAKVDCTMARVHATDDKNSPLVEKEVCPPAQAGSGEYGFLKLRYKLPGDNTSKLITTPITAANDATVCPPCADGMQCKPCPTNITSDDVEFSVAVASFAQMLKGGKYTGQMSYDDVISMAQAAKGDDEFGYRAEFINLVRLAKAVPALPDTQP